MTRMLLAITLLTGAASLAAQDVEKPFRYNGSGYVYFNLGACQHGYALVGGGGGGEGFLWRGLTIGAELGYHGFPSGGGRFGLLSLGMGYHFVDRKKPKKIDPFVTFSVLGLGLAGGGATAAGHLGGGLNYWFKDKIGVRTEVRLTAVGCEAITAFHIGFSFR